MVRTGLVILLALAFGSIKAQECYQTELSKKFNYKIVAVKTPRDSIINTSKIYIQIFKKIDKSSSQKIIVKTGYLFEDAFGDCSNFISYVTGKNRLLIADCSIAGNFGDFIVADFNFDGKEDFAVKRDSGGSGGPFYSYFIQNQSSVFKEDSFLTNNMGYFPCIIDSKNKKLTTFVHADAYGYNENIYKYNMASKKWILLKRIYRKA